MVDLTPLTGESAGPSWEVPIPSADFRAFSATLSSDNVSLERTASNTAATDGASLGDGEDDGFDLGIVDASDDGASLGDGEDEGFIDEAWDLESGVLKSFVERLGLESSEAGGCNFESGLKSGVLEAVGRG